MKVENLRGMISQCQLLESIEKSFGSDLAFQVALIDIDFYINIISKIGSNEGVLMTERISNYLLEENQEYIIGRFDRDEFLVINTVKSMEVFKEDMQRLRKSFRKQRFISDSSLYGKVPITISIGIASSHVYKDSSLLLKSAEIALGSAKKYGRNKVAESNDEITIHKINSRKDVTTILGSGLKGNRYDCTLEENPQIREPYGVDIGNSGEIYLVDRGNHSIKKIQDHFVSVVAGNGEYGYRGDGGEAVLCSLNKPSGVAFDHVNNRIYIADTANHCIRVIDSKGIITTFAGCGAEGYEGDGGRAELAKLSRPGGVVVDYLGNVYTNDYGNNVIRMIDKRHVITTIAGNGNYGDKGDRGKATDAELNKPYGLNVTNDGKTLYIVDYGNNKIRKIDMESKIIDTFCGCGTAGYSGDRGNAVNACINQPYWVSLLDQKYLLVADSANHCIRSVDIKTNIIHTVIGCGKSGYVDGDMESQEIKLNIPAGMIVNKEELIIVDYANNALRKANIKRIFGRVLL